MAKKRKVLKKTDKKSIRAAFLDNLPKTKKEHLELMLKFTERAIKSGNVGMIDQAKRLKEEIKNCQEN